MSVQATFNPASGKLIEDDRGERYRITDLLGRQGVVGDGPQTFVIEGLGAGALVGPHFHVVDQFQVFIAGSGRIGSRNIEPILIHYTDAFTPYGPIVGGPVGFEYVTVRRTADPGPKYMPASRAQRERLGGRHIVTQFDPSFEDSHIVLQRQPDGLAIEAIHAEPGRNLTWLEPENPGGTHIFVLDGTVWSEGAELGKIANIFVRPGEALPVLKAGEAGGRAVLLHFPDLAGSAEDDSR